jgi:hypothetical protein
MVAQQVSHLETQFLACRLAHVHMTAVTERNAPSADTINEVRHFSTEQRRGDRHPLRRRGKLKPPHFFIELKPQLRGFLVRQP